MNKMNKKNTTKPITGTMLAGYKMYSVEELATLLQITTVSVRNILKQGRMKSRRVGRRYFVTEEELKQYLNVN